MEQPNDNATWVSRMTQSLQGALGCNPSNTCQKVKDAIPVQLDFGMTESNQGVQLKLHLKRKSSNLSDKAVEEEEEAGMADFTATRPSTEETQDRSTGILHPCIEVDQPTEPMYPPTVLAPAFVSLHGPSEPSAPGKPKKEKRPSRRRRLDLFRRVKPRFRAPKPVLPEAEEKKIVQRSSRESEEAYWAEDSNILSRPSSALSWGSASITDTISAASVAQLYHASPPMKPLRLSELSDDVPPPRPSSRLNLLMPNLTPSQPTVVCERVVNGSKPPMSVAALTTELSKHVKESDIAWSNYFNAVVIDSRGMRMKPTMTVFDNNVVFCEEAVVAGIGPSLACVTRRIAEATTKADAQAKEKLRREMKNADAALNVPYFESKLTAGQPRLVDELTSVKIKKCCGSRQQMFGYWSCLDSLKRATEYEKHNVRLAYVNCHLLLISTRKIEQGSEVLLPPEVPTTIQFTHMATVIKSYPNLSAARRETSRKEFLEYYRDLELTCPQAAEALKPLILEALDGDETVFNETVFNRTNS